FPTAVALTAASAVLLATASLFSLPRSCKHYLNKFPISFMSGIKIMADKDSAGQIIVNKPPALSHSMKATTKTRRLLGRYLILIFPGAATNEVSDEKDNLSDEPWQHVRTRSHDRNENTDRVEQQRDDNDADDLVI